MNPPKILASLLLTAAAAAPLSSAHAALIAYEGFDYQAGAALVGGNGGSGFAGAWQSGLFSGGAPFSVAAGSLAHPGQASTGNSASESDASGYWGVRRSLLSSLGADGSTAYLSFLIRPTPGATAADFFGLYLGSSNAANDVFIGKGGGGVTDRWVVERRGGSSQTASDQVIDESTTLMVLKMDFAAGADTFSLFVNPQIGGSAPAADAVNTSINSGSITGIGLFGSHGWTIDEIRVGTQLSDVTTAAVPEPATLMLSLLGLLAVPMVARSRKPRSTGPVDTNYNTEDFQ